MKQRRLRECRLATIAQCAALTGLGSHEMMLGIAPTTEHASLYASYLLLRSEGWEWAAIVDAIVSDIRSSLDVGAPRRAADLLIVLRWLLAERHLQTVALNRDAPVGQARAGLSTGS
jgi:hypothetical protein